MQLFHLISNSGNHPDTWFHHLPASISECQQGTVLAASRMEIVKDEFDMEECYARAKVAGTQAQSLTVIVSPLDMQGMIGVMQVLAGRAHTIHEVYRGDDNWQMPQLDRP